MLNTLNDEFLRRKNQTPFYSLRRFSREIGVSQGTLSEMLNGNRKISPKSAARILKNINMPEEDKKNILMGTIAN